MPRKILKHTELDELLEPLALDPDGFEAGCLELIKDLDKKNVDLEIHGPHVWRSLIPSGATPSRASYVDQLRADIDTIELIDRETEARLARRIEFARLRLGVAQQEAGVDAEDAADGVGQMASSWMQNPKSRRLPSDRVMCRAAELHALRTELVERNLYLVLINVERYVHSSSSRADLIQEGSAALFRAVDGFDWRRGLLFRTYAVHWLNQAFRNYLYNFSNTVRVPVYLQKAMKQIQQAKIKLGDANATPDRIAEHTDLSENLVASALKAARSAYSLDAALSSDSGDGNRLRDLMPEPDDDGDPYTTHLEEVSLEDGLTEAMQRLSERERLVVSMRFGVGMEREHTLAEVAKTLGVSVERVRQIQVRAVNKLDTPGLRRDLEPFLQN